MDCAVQTTDCLIRSQVQYKDKLQVSDVPLASYLVYTSHVHGLRNRIP